MDVFRWDKFSVSWNGNKIALVKLLLSLRYSVPSHMTLSTIWFSRITLFVYPPIIYQYGGCKSNKYEYKNEMDIINDFYTQVTVFYLVRWEEIIYNLSDSKLLLAFDMFCRLNVNLYDKSYQRQMLLALLCHGDVSDTYLPSFAVWVVDWRLLIYSLEGSWIHTE